MKITTATQHFLPSFKSMFWEMFKTNVSLYSDGIPDLMIFTGGEDISPAIYGHENYASYVNPDRDQKELKLISFCVQNDVPMFGVCRGHQLLNAYFGGELIQHIQKSHPQYHEIYGDKTLLVNSLHHQGVVKTPLMGLYVYEDIIEVTADGNLFSVQFHPEFMMDAQMNNFIKQSLIKYCKLEA